MTDPALAHNPLGVMVTQAFPGPGNSGVTAQGDPPATYLLPHVERVVDEGFGAIEVTRLHDAVLRRSIAEVVAGLDVTFGAYVTQLVNAEGLHPFDLSHPEEGERRRAVDRLRVSLREAAEVGAGRVGLMSGRDPVLFAPDGEPAASRRARHREALVRSLVELAAETDAVLALLPFDRCPTPEDFPGAYKEALLGPVAELVEVVEAARQAGAANVCGALDTAHLRENGEGPRQVAEALEVLGYLHVSNCVIDPDAPDAHLRLGDRHPRFGCDGAEVGLDLLVEHVHVLDGHYGGPVTFEVKPIGDEDPWKVIDGARKAWRAALVAADDQSRRRS